MQDSEIMEVSAGDLQDTRLFAGLPPQELDVIARSGLVQTLPANTIYIRQGESSSALYVILKGQSQVYAIDIHGQRQTLSSRGPGEHVGEIAMLGDSVRTASVATLEESQFLVLSRRAFMECLSRNPQIGLNLEESLVLRSMACEVGRIATQRYRAWSMFRRSGLPLILLIGGCTGCGKSTVAAELALRLDIGRTQSTDLLREVMRLLVPGEADPALHASTYEAWQSVSESNCADNDSRIRLVAGYRAQAETITRAIDGVVSRSIKERVSTVIEGIHLQPSYCDHLRQDDAVIVPILLSVPNRDELKTHLTRRGMLAPARGSQRYLERMDRIWELQEYLMDQACRYGIATVENRHLSRSVDRVMAVVTETLLKRFAGQRNETS